MSFWKNKRVLISGGSGFLGSHVADKLKTLGCMDVWCPKHKAFDFRKMKDCESAILNFRPDIVIHLAATVGGIGFNQEHPGECFYDNASMGINMIEACRIRDVKKTVILGTICAYPKHTPTPFKEDDIWSGYPEETNAPYGLAKKMLLVQLQAYRQQYGFNGIYLLPVNLYGPRDNFNPNSSHVIPAMIRKFIDANESKAEKVVLWGTGEVSREFLYVEDCAEGILKAAESYDKPDPVNLGSGNSITIRDLAILIRDAVGYTSCKIEWDTSKPNGQPLRQLDVSRAKKEFGFEASTSFKDGLEKTIQWYLQNRS